MIKKLIDIKYSGITFALFLFLSYGIIPILFNDLSEINFTLFILSFFSSITILLAFTIPMNHVRLYRIYFNKNYFSNIILLSWIFIVIILYITSVKIPIVGLIQGLSKEELHGLRELFLKAREGWEVILTYMNHILTALFIPYIIVDSFVKKSKYRWYYVLLFFIYSISFLEKAYFLKIAIPLTYFYFFSQYYSKKKVNLIIIAIVLVLYLLFAITSSLDNTICEDDLKLFLSNDYIPCSTTTFFLWRVFSVPIFTALDSIEVFKLFFNSEYLWGATSSIISIFTLQEKIYFERLVFEFEWGQNLTGTGSSNAVFFIDAYINFGYVGVFFTSFFIGIIFRIIKYSNDLALHSLWPLIAFSLYLGSILGLLFSGGGLLMLFVFLIFKFNRKQNK